MRGFGTDIGKCLYFFTETAEKLSPDISEVILVKPIHIY
jgi:hypothetical protein